MFDSLPCKPNSVCPGFPEETAIHLGDASPRRSSDLPGGLAHRAGTHAVREDRNFLPIWSCSVWGLPCRLRYRRRGALLPHLFTLTPASRGGLFSVALSVTTGLNPHPLALPGTLLCGVRTFLGDPCEPLRPSGPAVYIQDYRFIGGPGRLVFRTATSNCGNHRRDAELEKK